MRASWTWRSISACGSSVSSSANASALASTSRESWLPGMLSDERGEREREQVGGNRRRARRVGAARGGRSPSAELAREQQPERGDDRDEGDPARGCRRGRRGRARGRRPSAARGRSALVEQVVVEDDPLGRADAVDVGVERGRAAAGVDAVDLADLDPARSAELEHVRARAARLGQRLEVVEDRREHDRREPGEDGREPATTAALPGIHQRAREAAHQREQQRPRRPRSARRVIAGRARRRPRATSPSDWVERPTSTARSCGDRAESAASTTAISSGDRRAPAAAAPSSGRAPSRSSAPAHARRAPERERDQHRALDREAAEHEPALAVAVVLARARARSALK